MELLPQARGKGLHMFVQRRQRIDELTAEQEQDDLRSKSALAEEAPEPEFVSPSKGRDVPINPQQKFQDYQNQPRIINQKNACINGLESCQASSPKPLVPNRTAKPFLGGIDQSPRPYSPVRSPTASSKNIFKVAIPVNSSPHVWSPTGDVIASRDERIVVPAIKTGTLPEVKKRGQNKSDFRDHPEDDCFGLGAEACNFMQVPTVRQKHPPKVLPKPAINPACPPWSAESRSPVPPAHPNPAAKPWTHTAPSTQSPFQPKLPWTKTHDGGSVVSCPPQRQSSYHYTPKTPLTCPRESVSELDSSDGITPKGKGAELFARRQSRMEKFVVDDETVQANRVRSPSPTLSMPSTWKYSSIIRAPAPVSYNPIVSPLYPHAAQKQLPPVTGSKSKPQGDKEKSKRAPKHLSVMDVMKHQPYQLDSSLFTYGSNMDPKVTGTKASSILAPSTAGGQQGAKPGGPIYSRSRSVSLPSRHSSGSNPVFHPSPGPLDRPTFWAEEPQRGPLSLVSERSCGHRWSLPEDKPMVYGPPFRPAQPLTVSHRYTGTGSLPRNFSPSHPHYRVSWRM